MAAICARERATFRLRKTAHTFGRRHRSTTANAEPPILVTIKGPRATLTLNRPKTGNALDGDIFNSLSENLAKLEADSSIRTVVLTGAGKYFCTGMNLGASGDGMAGDSEAQLDRAQRMFRGVEKFSKPTIALIQGSCYGGGNGLAMACDIRVASNPNVTFTLSEVKIGFSPAIISKYIVREWGVSKTREAMLRARPVTAAELAHVNALHHICEDMESAEAKVEEIVRELVAGAPGAQNDVKRLVAASATESEAQAQSVIKDIFVEMLRPSIEGKYGLECFQAKKKPDWSTLASS